VHDNTTDELRRAYADDLTDAQLKFIFYAQQERERMKQRNSKSPNSGKTTYL